MDSELYRHYGDAAFISVLDRLEILSMTTINSLEALKRLVLELEASIESRGKRRAYIITPDAITKLYKNHQRNLLKRGLRNQSLFEAYVQYCFSPKHT